MKNLNTMHAERVVEMLNTEMHNVYNNLINVIDAFEHDAIRPCAARKMYVSAITKAARYNRIGRGIERKYNVNGFYGIENFDEVIRFFE